MKKPMTSVMSQIESKPVLLSKLLSELAPNSKFIDDGEDVAVLRVKKTFIDISYDSEQREGSQKRCRSCPAKPHTISFQTKEAPSGQIMGVVCSWGEVRDTGMEPPTPETCAYKYEYKPAIPKVVKPRRVWCSSAQFRTLTPPSTKSGNSTGSIDSGDSCASTILGDEEDALQLALLARLLPSQRTDEAFSQIPSGMLCDATTSKPTSVQNVEEPVSVVRPECIRVTVNTAKKLRKEGHIGGIDFTQMRMAYDQATNTREAVKEAEERKVKSRKSKAKAKKPKEKASRVPHGHARSRLTALD